MNRISPRLVTALAAIALLSTACDESADSILGVGSTNESRLRNRQLAQVDRMGLPAVATVFIPTAQKDAYNEAAPADDPTEYADEVVAQLTAFGVDAATSAALADALLPDVIPINTAEESGFLNGRRLQDDVITAELMLIFGSNAALNDDHVDANDKDALATFPFLAGPHL